MTQSTKALSKKYSPLRLAYLWLVALFHKFKLLILWQKSSNQEKSSLVIVSLQIQFPMLLVVNQWVMRLISVTTLPTNLKNP